MIFPSLYEELDMERYARLVVDALPGRNIIIALCDDTGHIVWCNEDNNNLDDIILKCNKSECTNTSEEGCIPLTKQSNAGCMTCYNLGVLAGRSAGKLVFYNSDSETTNRGAVDPTLSILNNVTEIVKAELGYLYEVNAMAAELGERYDELSMLRASDLALAEYHESRHILSTYIRSCAEHLNVDYAAIWIASRHEIYPGGIAYKNQSTEILALLERLSISAFSMFENGRDGFGINDKDEELRSEILLPVDKKVLLIPVLDRNDKPCGVLACLNEFYNKDFSNSDKSTLEAVSRKTYKYLLSTQDEVTQLLNRKGFEESVCRTISNTDSHTDIGQYVVLFNIDQFKVVNAAYGMTTGDMVLSSVAGVIAKEEYRLKYIARLEADLFAAVIVEPENKIEGLVSTICKDIDATSIHVNEKNLTVKSRAGVISLNSKETALADHLYAAELALSTAKEESRQVITYKPGNTALLKRKHQLTQVENIKNALKEDRFELYCQRIQPLSGDEMHYEVLVRMVDEEGDLVPPDEFIPVAERFNLMSQVDRWIIKNTFQLLCREGYREISADYKWGINLSGMTIGDDDFHDFVSDCLREYNFLPTNLYFEITETAAIKNFQNCTAFMNKIHSMGVQFALDDFGSGLSSFSYLKKLSIDYLKIDGSLVKDIVSSRLDQTMVSSIANIANVLNVKTIAEYVEDDLILEVLRDINIDYAQGYGIMKPQPIEIELQNMLSCSENKICSSR